MRAATFTLTFLACCGRRMRLARQTEDHGYGQPELHAERSLASLILGSFPAAAWQSASLGRLHGPCVCAPTAQRAAVPTLDFSDLMSDLTLETEEADAAHSTAEDTGAREPEAFGLAVGIDLGTTTSSIAAIVNGKPKIVHRVNSVVRPLGEEGSAKESVVGEIASETPGAIFSAKRLMGHTYKAADQTLPRRCELRNLLAPLPPQRSSEGVIGGERAGLLDFASGEVVPPEWVGSQVLTELLDASEQVTGTRAQRAVIGVPAHFLQSQQEATREAARLAGLNTVKLITEPVAAALAYDVQSASAKGGVENEIVCVYDIGGGTLDVSILQMGGGTAEVLAGAGNSWLGGDDFDAAMATFLARQAGWPVSEAATPELSAIARTVKESLSSKKKVCVELPANPSLDEALGSGTEDEQMISIELSRGDMSKACSDLIHKMQLPVVEAAQSCQIPLRLDRKLSNDPAKGNAAISARPSLRNRRIDRVLLVGAASRMTFIAEFLEKMTDCKPSTNKVNPEDAVALGAAVQAGILQGELQRYDIISNFEAAYIRGLARGNMSQKAWKRATRESSDQRSIFDRKKSKSAKHIPGSPKGKSEVGKIKIAKHKRDGAGIRFASHTNQGKKKTRKELLEELDKQVREQMAAGSTLSQ